MDEKKTAAGREAVSVVIKGQARYGHSERSYEDRLTMTARSVTYEYTPYVATVKHPTRSWSYVTDSRKYTELFRQVAEKATDVVSREVHEHSSDKGGIEFRVSFTDGSRLKRTCWVDGEYFAELFGLIRTIVPVTEEMPRVLRMPGEGKAKKAEETAAEKE